MLETGLYQLFDYQKFQGNPDLQQVIDSVHARYTRRQLSLEDLEYVNAAGAPYLPDQEKKKNN